MAKERKIVDYSRFHEVLINMNPSQQWFDEWGEDAIACDGNIRNFPYFKKIENDISFFKQVEGMKSSLEIKKKDIKATMKEYSGIKDENFEERIKQCNKCLNMEINNYEKFEYLKFIFSNIDYLRREDVLEYEQECKTVIKAITSVFITRELRKDKTFDHFCKNRNFFLQVLFF